MISTRRIHERPNENWEDMKAIMRKRLIPSYRELYQKLSSLNQGFNTIDDCYEEMEVVMTRVIIEKDREAIIARILSGLNKIFPTQWNFIIM